MIIPEALRLAVEKYLRDNDPEGFGCACDPSGHICGPCRARAQQAPLRAALASPPAQAPDPEGEPVKAMQAMDSDAPRYSRNEVRRMLGEIERDASLYGLEITTDEVGGLGLRASHPAPAQPLAEQAIRRIHAFGACLPDMVGPREQWPEILRFARAIEAAVRAQLQIPTDK